MPTATTCSDIENVTKTLDKIMRKRLTISESPSVSDQAWLNLETAATLELTSEDERHPIEAALSSRGRQGWRASGPGPQTIRLVFDQPQRLRRINLVFNEAETRRTQEFVLRWRSEADPGFREIVRQQWNFSPPQTTREIEDYQVDLRKREGIGVGDRPRYWRRKHVRVARKPAVGLVHAR